MPAKIDLLLESNKELSCQMGSLFQGVIMRNLPKEEGYGDQLHIPELHAYTQHLEKDKEENWHWILTFLNKAAKEQIWDKGLNDTKSIELEQNGITVQIKDKKFTEEPYEKLNTIFRNEEPPRKFKLQFVTPTAFKSDGHYVLMPDLRHIYQSIIKKYDACSKNVSLYDEDTLDQLCKFSFISDYNLRSTRFHLEGIKIPSFLGSIVIRSIGKQTMSSFLDMLFKISEYSGVGIKASIGMGATKYYSIK